MLLMQSPYPSSLSSLVYISFCWLESRHRDCSPDFLEKRADMPLHVVREIVIYIGSLFASRCRSLALSTRGFTEQEVRHAGSFTEVWREDCGSRAEYHHHSARSAGRTGSPGHFRS